MSISPSNPQSGHLSCCEPEIFGISIWEEHCGHSTVIISGTSLLTTRFLITFLFVGFLTSSSEGFELENELSDVDLEGLEIGTSIKISSINLPENVTPTIQGRDFVIATVAAPTIVKEPEKPAEAEGEAAAAEGSEASTTEGEDKKEESGDKKAENEKSTPEKK